MLDTIGAKMDHAPRRAFSFQDIIAPWKPTDFIASHYEKAPLHLQRNNPTYYDGLLTLDDIDRHLTHVGHYFPDIAVANALGDIATSEYTFPNRRIDKARVFQLFDQGCTIVMRRMHLAVPALAALARSAEQFFGCEFQCNAYFTPPGNAQGFKIHYDTHEIFAIQVLGSKHWRLYGTPVALPLGGQDFDRNVVDPGERTGEFVLRAGDLYYLPRGLVHDAVAVEEPSVHITLGMLSQTWTELMIEAMLSVCHENVEFRRNLPIGALGPNADDFAIERSFQDLVGLFAAKAKAGDALERFRDAFVSTRQPLAWGRSSDMLRLSQITTDTMVGIRSEIIHRLLDREDKVVLHVHSSEISFPAAARPALEFALNGRAFRVGDVPLADDGSRLILVRRLVKEGVLTFR